MANDLEKNINTMLDTEKGKIPTSIKLLAMSLDKKFTDVEHKIDTLRCDSRIQHEEVLKAIESLQQSNNKKFDKLKVVMFFSEYPKLASLVALGLLVLIVYNLIVLL